MLSPYLKFSLFISLCFFCITSSAQEKNDSLTLKRDTLNNLSKPILQDSISKKTVIIKTSLDTVSIGYFLLHDLNQRHQFKDSSIINLDNYHPAFNTQNPYLHLGNLGSSATPYLYHTSGSLGINYGYNAYQAYNFKADSIKLIDSYRPINDLYFSPHQGQENFYVKARFARTFSDIIFNVNYRRVIQEGFYLNQGTKTTNLTTSFHYKSKENKLQSIWSLIINNNNENHNGGILTTATETDLFYYSQPLYFVRDRIPIQIDGADSRYAQAALQINNHYNLKGLNSDQIKIDFHHTLNFEKSNERYSDADITEQELFYGQFFKDPRGIRLYQGQTKFKNDFGLSIQKSQLVHFNFGLRHTYHSINYGPEKERINELILYGKANSRYKNLGLRAFAELGTLALTGDLNVGGSASFNHELFALQGGLRVFRIRPNLKFEKLYLNDVLIYDNKDLLDKPFGTVLSGQLEFKPINIKISLAQTLENNTTYFDSLGIVQQLEEVLSLTKIQVASKLSYSIIHIDNNLLFQLHNSEKLALPTYRGQHRLYLKTKIFDKKLESQIGGEFIFTPRQRARRFLPAIGAFGHTSEYIDAYPMLNAFVNFKVNEFKVFLKFENFLDYGRIRPYYLVQAYPQLDARFRMGISWLLYN